MQHVDEKVGKGISLSSVMCQLGILQIKSNDRSAPQYMWAGLRGSSPFTYPRAFHVCMHTHGAMGRSEGSSGDSALVPVQAFMASALTHWLSHLAGQALLPASPLLNTAVYRAWLHSSACPGLRLQLRLASNSPPCPASPAHVVLTGNEFLSLLAGNTVV